MWGKDSIKDVTEHERYVMTVVFRYMGIGMLYFLSQYCIVFLLIPSFLEYTFLGIPFIFYLISLTTLIICYVYSRWVYHDVES